MGIIAILMVLLMPAFTGLNTANDLTRAASTIKETLDRARTYAQAHNTYVCVGFFEENAANPPSPGTGRLVMFTIASTDGSKTPITSSPVDTGRLKPVTKLIKIDNVHLPLLDETGSQRGTGELFDTRPQLQNDPGVGYNDSRFGELNSSPTAPTNPSPYPFWYPLTAASQSEAQYVFRKTLLFGPTGENRINSTYNVRRVVEIGLVQAAGDSALSSTTGNLIAIQIGGFDGDVKVYRR